MEISSINEKIPTFINLLCHNYFINGFYELFTLDSSILLHILILYNLSLTWQKLQNLKNLDIKVTLTTMSIMKIWLSFSYDRDLRCSTCKRAKNSKS